MTKYAHGFAFPDADSFMVNEIKPDGSYQRAQLDRALSYVSNWTLAIDAGAHVGTWSKILAGRFQQVIAVEPSADTAEALTENMQTFGATNVDIRRVALGSAMGRATMALDDRSALMQNTGARFVQPGGVIPVVTVDSWELPSLGLLKMDIEGSEYAALLGARGTLLRCRPIVIFENKFHWAKYGVSRLAPQEFLIGLGYQRLEIVHKDEIWGPGR